MVAGQRYSVRDRLRLTVARRLEKRGGNAGTGRDGPGTGRSKAHAQLVSSGLYLGKAQRLLGWRWRIWGEDTRVEGRSLAGAVICYDGCCAGDHGRQSERRRIEGRQWVEEGRSGGPNRCVDMAGCGIGGVLESD